MIKKILAFILLFTILCSSGISVFASTDETIGDIGTKDEAENDASISTGLEIQAKSALLMEADTGTVLYSNMPNQKLPLASVTKIMSLLLVCEAIEDGRIKEGDNVTVSLNASGMGGSQIFLKEGEVFTVEELLKSTVIASANDSIVALAEHIYGSEKAFVDKMNEKAEELGMTNTVFENCTGLDDTTTNHYSTAYDIALMSRELIKRDLILKYSNVWQDSIRNGQFILTNTNRLVRYYDGCTGLKTGSTDKAGFCMSATAKRGDMHLIAVVMGCETRDKRNEAARTMLDYGFANFAIYKDKGGFVDSREVRSGRMDEVELHSGGFTKLVEKAKVKNVEVKYELPEYVEAPLNKGDVVGKISYYLNEEKIGECDIYINEQIDRIGIFEIIFRIFMSILIGK